MRTLRIAMLALALAALTAACGKKKEPVEPAPAAEPATEAPAEDGTTPPTEDPANPCGGGEANPCG
jgi:hypothetical protein